MMRAEERAADRHWGSLPAPPLARAKVPRALHLTMRDGVKIAIDVHLPERVRCAPAIVRQTRYLRSVSARVPGLAAELDLYARTRRVFLAAGYAWVDVDVRGTGASTGSWPYPWSPEEVKDGAEVVDWIVRQTWSNGRVGALGISYDGTSAEMLATTGHPAVRAVAPLFSLYDVYADVAFPGGIHASWFTEGWSAYNRALDQNEHGAAIARPLWLIGRAGGASPSPRGLERLLAPLARDRAAWDRRVVPVLSALARGVRPVDGDLGVLLAEALLAHADNGDVHASALAIRHRDQIGLTAAAPDGSIDTFSPHALRREAIASGVPMCSISGWRDGAYQHSAIKRFLSVPTPGSRLTLGPWVHSGKLRVTPFGVACTSSFDFDAELLSFFGAHLFEGASPERPIRYYTMVEERWKEAPRWPPPGAHDHVLHLGPGRTLSPNVEAAGADVLHERGANGTGERSRWRSLLSLVPGDYPDRRERDEKILYWESAPLDRAQEVTGHPRVVLHVSWDTDGGHVFVYLEDRAPDGRVAYVTEGQLDAAFRTFSDTPPCTSAVPLRSFLAADRRPIAAAEIVELSFDLLPISWRFERGHRVRLAIAGADRDHFTPLSPRTLHVHRSEAHPSRFVLPVME